MTSPSESDSRHRLATWLLAFAPLALVVVLAAIMFGVDLPGLERTGPAVEEVVVERTTLTTGRIGLDVRNDGPDPVTLVQAIVNDAYVAEATLPTSPLGRLEGGRVDIPYPWITGEDYEVALLTSTGVSIGHTIAAAAPAPRRDASTFGALGLLGLLVGLVPILMGLVWLPFARRARESVVRFLLALTVGLLAVLAVESLVEGFDQARQGAQALGGPTLVILGAVLAYITLSGVDGFLARRGGGSGWHAALMVAVGIGVHNLGEGLAIGGAYAAGALALGAFLIIGFALHNATEGLAIVAPLACDAPPLRALLLLGAIAGLPVVPGIWVGAWTSNPQIAALLLGVGAGAIAQVIVQITPAIRPAGRSRGLEPIVAYGLAAGVVAMWGTGLLTSV